MSGVTTTGATIIGNPLTLPNLPNGIESLPSEFYFGGHLFSGLVVWE